MPDRPDLDEKFSLWPLDPEEGLKRLMDPEEESIEDAGEDEDDL